MNAIFFLFFLRRTAFLGHRWCPPWFSPVKAAPALLFSAVTFSSSRQTLSPPPRGWRWRSPFSFGSETGSERRNRFSSSRHYFAAYDRILSLPLPPGPEEAVAFFFVGIEVTPELPLSLFSFRGSFFISSLPPTRSFFVPLHPSARRRRFPPKYNAWISSFFFPRLVLGSLNRSGWTVFPLFHAPLEETQEPLFMRPDQCIFPPFPFPGTLSFSGFSPGSLGCYLYFCCFERARPADSVGHLLALLLKHFCTASAADRSLVLVMGLLVFPPLHFLPLPSKRLPFPLPVAHVPPPSLFHSGDARVQRLLFPDPGEPAFPLTDMKTRPSSFMPEMPIAPACR